MRGTAAQARLATPNESDAFLMRLRTMLDRTQRRLARLSDSNYVLRVMTVESHSVIAHTRKTFTKVYLAKKVGLAKRLGKSKSKTKPTNKPIRGKGK